MKIKALPEENLLLVFSYLSERDRAVAKRVCKLWNCVASDPSLCSDFLDHPRKARQIFLGKADLTIGPTGQFIGTQLFGNRLIFWDVEIEKQLIDIQIDGQPLITAAGDSAIYLLLEYQECWTFNWIPLDNQPIRYTTTLPASGEKLVAWEVLNQKGKPERLFLQTTHRLILWGENHTSQVAIEKMMWAYPFLRNQQWHAIFFDTNWGAVNLETGDTAPINSLTTLPGYAHTTVGFGGARCFAGHRFLSFHHPEFGGFPTVVDLVDDEIVEMYSEWRARAGLFCTKHSLHLLDISSNTLAFINVEDVTDQTLIPFEDSVHSVWPLAIGQEFYALVETADEEGKPHLVCRSLSTEEEFWKIPFPEGSDVFIAHTQPPKIGILSRGLLQLFTPRLV